MEVSSPDNHFPILRYLITYICVEPLIFIIYSINSTILQYLPGEKETKKLMIRGTFILNFSGGHSKNKRCNVGHSYSFFHHLLEEYRARAWISKMIVINS